ncbi:sulfotransferase family 2 domain-containing protein [Isoptericola sp. BMS4]|uniref:sulfotransferase family 2 domain-containing protein n=1 Tax=Isoptericola sp. BMS4 TaxID=2527875 RepID=UPI001421FB2A|nr:sulfotransferase family 2 domain-containing protein [Isoptericola sp. BMS4]
MKIAPVSPADASGAGDVENSWVLPEQRIAFVSIGKNACTSIKWLLAEISGQDVARIMAADSLQSTRRMLIHHRRSWRDTPKLTQLAPEARAEISPANGWFVFAVVRDPRLRAFSAWQSKFLVGDPSYSGRKYAGRDWLPRTPESAQDVLDDWERFVGALERGGPAGGISLGDGHFAPHTERLHEETVPYSRIYDISEIGELTGDLTDHLVRTVGSSPELALARENDTPLAAGREVYAGGIRQRLEAVYASDFERFGDLWSDSFSRVLDRPAGWSSDALRDIGARRAINEQVARLDAKAKEQRRRVRELTRENDELRRRLDGRQPGASWLARAVHGGGRAVRRAVAR